MLEKVAPRPIVRASTIVTVLIMLLSSFVRSNADGDVATAIADIKSGPSIYYTPDAAAYYSSKGTYGISGLSTDKNAAIRSFRAMVKLGNMPLSQAREAVPILLDLFPKAIHISVIQQARYMGEGTFEDCISTYVMGEKNKFILSSTFLDYNTLSQCEDYVEAMPEKEIITKQTGAKGTVTGALFNIRITFTVYGAECALSKLTGMSLGHDPSAWRQWWLQSGTVATSPSPYVTMVPVTSVPPSNAYSDIVVGGKYRVFLTTGDELVGVVDSRDDTSMVFETTSGKPYSFRYTLMSSYQVLELPPPKSVIPTKTEEFISYDELKRRAPLNPQIEVKISNGTLFKGKLTVIDESGLEVNVSGSRIPIAKEIIKQIHILPDEAPSAKTDTTAAAPKKAAGPLDSIWVKNPVLDKYGRPKTDVLYSGSIIDEGDNYVSLKIADGAPQKFSRDAITRFIRHSSDKGDDALQRYAKPLTCPADMLLIDMPFGRANKPFFKVCIDKYEYPNRQGSVPKSRISYAEAAGFCEQQGKRLCTAEEWSWSCSGKDGFVYPYGQTLDKERCNSDTRIIQTSGNFVNCVSPFGVIDMVGNVFEWVSASGQPGLMGGPFSKCQTISPSPNGEATPQAGLRCCKGN